jgi:hypothetical protein
MTSISKQLNFLPAKTIILVTENNKAFGMGIIRKNLCGVTRIELETQNCWPQVRANW